MHVLLAISRKIKLLHKNDHWPVHTCTISALNNLYCALHQSSSRQNFLPYIKCLWIGYIHVVSTSYGERSQQNLTKTPVRTAKICGIEFRVSNFAHHCLLFHCCLHVSESTRRQFSPSTSTVPWSTSTLPPLRPGSCLTTTPRRDPSTGGAVEGRPRQPHLVGGTGKASTHPHPH